MFQHLRRLKKYLPASKLGRQVLLFFASLAMSLLLVELTFRVAGIRGNFHRPRVDRNIPMKDKPVTLIPHGFYSNMVSESTYDSDPRDYFEPGHTISHRYNSFGWRDEEHSFEKPAGVFRILGLGDSYLWGQGVKRPDICLNQLPQLLAKDLPGKTIETINAGISSFNTVDERDQLKARGLLYDPDLVIVHFVLNDVEANPTRTGPKIEFFTDYTDISYSTDWLSRYSCFWSWCRQRVINRIRGERYVRACVEEFDDESPGWVASRNALKEIQRICEENNVRLCVVIFPFFHNLDGDYPFQPIHDVVTKFCREQNIPVLDLREAYKGYQGPELWAHPTDQHPNEIAHRIAAEAIAQFLRDHSAELLTDG